MRIVDAYPALALNAPGRDAEVVVEVEASQAAEVVLAVQLMDLTEPVARGSATVTVAVGRSRHRLKVGVPAARDDQDADNGGRARGYQVRASLGTARPAGASTLATSPGSRAGSSATGTVSAGATETASATTALLAAEHWRHAPRYGFLSEFAPEGEGDAAAAAQRVEQLAKLHLTIVQFYDWMYRHYDLVADSERYRDAMGRDLSLGTVRHRIDACHRHGMAAMAYGAVYGPEPEFILKRPEWLLYDANGSPIHLIELFYITDLRPGSGWREHILREFEESVGELGFDGIHLDQYGFPKLAYDHQGALVDLSADFPSVVDEAAARVARVRQGAAVIFNAVNDWPIDTVASSDQAAVYIEVWAPHTRYRDLVALARRARGLAGKQVILSAYLQPFREGGPAAEWSLRYATAVIAAAGAHHLVLGEGDAVLRDPYYPNHGRLSAEGLAVIRRYYDHTAAYTDYLHALDLRPVEKTFITGVNTAFSLTGAPVSTSPQPGSLYVTCSQRAGQLVINLVNLTGTRDDSWDAPQEPAPTLAGLVLEAEPFLRPTRICWASPDDRQAGTLRLEHEVGEGGRLRIRLPPLCLWATVVIDHG